MNKNSFSCHINLRQSLSPYCNITLTLETQVTLRQEQPSSELKLTQFSSYSKLRNKKRDSITGNNQSDLEMVFAKMVFV